MKNIPNKDGGTLIYDSGDWPAGLGPEGKFGVGVFRKQTIDEGFATLSAIDPFSSYGVLSPGIASSANATNNTQMTGYMAAFSLTDNSTGLGVDSGGKIHQATVSGAALAIINAGIYPHTIAYAAGSGYVGQDGILYRHNSGGTAPANSVVSYFYSAYNSNNWDVGALVNLTTFDDDFMSSIPTTPLDITTGDGDDSTQRPAPHFMCIGADGILYIGSGRYIHAYDGNTGNNGTFSAKVLTLPQGFQVTSLLKENTNLRIFGSYYATASGTGEAYCYVWDYLNLDITATIPLEDNQVSCSFMWKGSPVAITSGPIGRNGRVKIKVLSGNSVQKLADFGAFADAPTARGVVIVDDLIYINSAGNLVTYGNKYRPSSAINSIATIGTGTTSGVLFWNEINSCFAGSAGTQQFYNINNGHGTAGLRGYAYPVPLSFGKIARLAEVRVQFYSTLSAGGTNGTYTLQLSLDLNTSGLLTVINGLSSVSIPLIKKYTQDTLSVQFNQQFTLISPIMSWVASTGGTSPQVSRLEIDYKIEDVNT